MSELLKFLVCFIAGIGAGLGTGFAGMSAAAVISPMLITFPGHGPLHGCGHRPGLRRAGQRRQCLHLRQKQKSGYPQRPGDDVYSAGLHTGGQLGVQQGKHHHGQLFPPL